MHDTIAHLEYDEFVQDLERHACQVEFVSWLKKDLVREELLGLGLELGNGADLDDALIAQCNGRTRPFFEARKNKNGVVRRFRLNEEHRRCLIQIYRLFCETATDIINTQYVPDRYRPQVLTRYSYASNSLNVILFKQWKDADMQMQHTQMLRRLPDGYEVHQCLTHQGMVSIGRRAENCLRQFSKFDPSQRNRAHNEMYEPALQRRELHYLQNAQGHVVAVWVLLHQQLLEVDGAKNQHLMNFDCDNCNPRVAHITLQVLRDYFTAQKIEFMGCFAARRAGYTSTTQGWVLLTLPNNHPVQQTPEPDRPPALPSQPAVKGVILK